MHYSCESAIDCGVKACQSFLTTASAEHGERCTAAGTVLGLLTPGLGGFVLFVICAVCRLQDAERIEVYFVRVCASCREGFF